MKCLKCGAENKDDAVFCEKCGTKLEQMAKTSLKSNKKTGIGKKDEKTEKILAWSFLGFVVLIIFMAIVYIPSSSSDDTGINPTPTENEYVANVNNWTSIIDRYGPVADGDNVTLDFTEQEQNMDDCAQIAATMSLITPPAKYASYNTIFKQALMDREHGYDNMTTGEEQGDHAMYNYGKKLLSQSASEFASISNQTKEMTTWN